MTAKPRIRLSVVEGAVSVPQTPLGIAKARFGRLFAHEHGSDFLRHPEPVLSRWARRADWRNVNPNPPKEKA